MSITVSICSNALWKYTPLERMLCIWLKNGALPQMQHEGGLGISRATYRGLVLFGAGPCAGVRLSRGTHYEVLGGCLS